MRVGFDISQLAHPGGVATYTKNLSTYLSKSKDVEMVYFYSSLRKRFKGDLKNVKNFPIPPIVLEKLLNNFRIPIEYFVGSVDIFHSSDWIQPKTRAKKVTTYHDVVPLKYPDWSVRKIIKVNQKRLQVVEKEIDKVIAVSENTKKDLLEISKIPAEKIVVIYEGVDSRFFPRNEKEVADFKRRVKLPEHFILAVGGIGERRNLLRIKQAAKDYNLIITGENIPYVDESEMPLLYAGADLLLYPSLYEGFGLPILEAMACGCPVLTANVSSMPEIAGDGAVLVNPESVEDIKNGLTKLKDEKFKKILIDKGFKQSKKFSWQKCAQETVKVYQSLM